MGCAAPFTFPYSRVEGVFFIFLESSIMCKKRQILQISLKLFLLFLVKGTLLGKIGTIIGQKCNIIGQDRNK